MQRQYPVGKAQQMVLDALGLTATGSSDANAQFEKIGIVVTSKREGKSVIPQIVVKDRTDGGWDNGEGYSFTAYRKLTQSEFKAIEQWIVKLASNSVEQPESPKPAQSELKTGDKIIVKAHTEYKHLVGNAVVKPPKSYEVAEFTTTIADIYSEELEDIDGHIIKDRIVVLPSGDEISIREHGHLIVKVS